MTSPEDTSLAAQLAALADRAEPSPDGWARIEARARRHDRRSRVFVAATLSVAVLLVAIAVGPRLAKRHSTGVSVSAPTIVTPPSGVTSPANAPTSTPATTGAGVAAWVSAGQLWLSTGTGSPRPVGGSDPAADPAWSFDGRWVSYLRDQGTATTELWVVHPDGTDNRKLWTGKPGGIEWSPTADELAVSDAPAVGVGGLLLVATDGSSERLVSAAVEVNSFSWSPDGQSIAYGAVVSPATTYQSPLDILAVHGSAPGTTVTVLRASAGDGIVVGPWWPDGTGLLYWTEPRYSKTAEADGLPLMSVGRTGSTPVTLATTLVDPAWLTWAPDGRILVVAGAGAQPSDNKSLELCPPTGGACTAIPAPANTVSLDPAWSPDGQQLAFVVAGWSAHADAPWYNTRQLWVAPLDDLAAGHPVAGAPAGAADPSWSSDGQTIGYTTATSVEVVPAVGGQAVGVSGATPQRGTTGLDGETAYGKTTWAGHAVWSP